MTTTIPTSVQYVDDNTDIFPMKRVGAGHYRRQVGRTLFEAYRSDADDVQQAGPRRWYGVVDGVIVAEGPNYRSVKIGMVDAGYLAKAQERERKDAAKLIFEEAFGTKLPANL